VLFDENECAICKSEPMAKVLTPVGNVPRLRDDVFSTSAARARCPAKRLNHERNTKTPTTMGILPF
jgi:hypothetical protein